MQYNYDLFCSANNVETIAHQPMVPYCYTIYMSLTCSFWMSAEFLSTFSRSRSSSVCAESRSRSALVSWFCSTSIFSARRALSASAASFSFVRRLSWPCRMRWGKLQSPTGSSGDSAGPAGGSYSHRQVCWWWCREGGRPSVCPSPQSATGNVALCTAALCDNRKDHAATFTKKCMSSKRSGRRK